MMRKKHNTTLPVICSNKISNIHWHLINLCAVILFYVSQYADVILAHEIDRHTLKHHTNSASRRCNLQINSLAPKTTRTTNAMDVKFTVIWEIIIYDKRNLLNIQSSSPNIRSD